ncbi:S8 family serine peptidase [Lysobacter koreensis]|uniref:S8 family serine peptidase n=1 Tax=Lysobacter koreensis TaxID=266122 RepID=A0ABW2YQG4_9GAMM
MSVISQRRVRLHALAAATAVALSSFVAAPALAGKAELSGLESAGTHDRFIVKYRDGSAERADVAKASAGLGRAAAGARTGMKMAHLRRMSSGADVVKADRKLDRAEAQSLMLQLAADPNVEYVEVDQLMKAVMTPNDTFYSSEQWHYFNATGGMKANEAWDVTSGVGSVVAVIDTGITNHTDLNANILPGYDFINDAAMARDGNGRDSNPNDEGDWYAANECGAGVPASNSSWHGTHVAGTVAAVTNNASGVAGVAFGAKVVPVRVLGKCGGYTSDIADAITWASGGTVSGVPANANPAEVINMSLGGSGTCSATYQNAINGAVGRGTTVVVAAGNSNVNVSGAVPANCANVIAVASTTITGQRSSFSNYGTGIDIAAPGSDIHSTLNAGTTVPGAQSYASYNGTSMATPHVAGVVALVQAHATTPKTPAQMEALIKSTARAFPVTPTQTIGPGILNAKAAVDAANGGGGGGTTTYSNGTDFTISDNVTVDSPIAVSGRTGNAPSNASVTVAIVHTYQGDLKVDLVAPDGSLYNIHNRTGGSADNVNKTVTLNLSTEVLNGTWKLRVNDNAAGDVGYINSWSVTF